MHPFCKLHPIPITVGSFEEEIGFVETEEIRLYNVNMVNKFLTRIILEAE